LSFSLDRLTNLQYRLPVVVLIVLAGLGAYINTFTNDFVWDDASSVLLNEHIKNPSYFFQLFKEDQHPFGTGQGNFYRPLVATSFMLDYALASKVDGRPNPLVFHLTNALWHVAAALVLFGLLERLRVPRFVSLVVPIVYVVHPLHTEAVAYISGRADPMAAAFVYAALICALWEGSPVRHAVGLVSSSVFFVAALLCKESAMAYVALLALVQFFRPVSGDRKKTYLARGIPLVAGAIVLGVYLGLRATVLKFASTTATVAVAPFGQRLHDASTALAEYVKLIFVPVGLHMERSLTDAPSGEMFIGGLLFGAFLSLLVAGLVRGRWRIALGLGWFLVTWLPISGLFPLNAPMAEHWMYVPLAGLLWAGAEILAPIVRFRLPAIVTGMVLAAYCFVMLFLTIDRNKDWRDDITLFEATLRENPNSARVHYNLAVAYDDIRNEPENALPHYLDYLRITGEGKQTGEGGVAYTDQEIEAHLAAGAILADQHRYEEAVPHLVVVAAFKDTPHLKPLAAESAMILGQCMLATNHPDRARMAFDIVLSLYPEMKDDVVRIVEAWRKGARQPSGSRQ